MTDQEKEWTVVKKLVEDTKRGTAEWSRQECNAPNSYSYSFSKPQKRGWINLSFFQFNNGDFAPLVLHHKENVGEAYYPSYHTISYIAIPFGSKAQFDNDDHVYRITPDHPLHPLLNEIAEIVKEEYDIATWARRKMAEKLQLAEMAAQKKADEDLINSMM